MRVFQCPQKDGSYPGGNCCDTGGPHAGRNSFSTRAQRYRSNIDGCVYVVVASYSAEMSLPV
jgi:hypothetical protein